MPPRPPTWLMVVSMSLSHVAVAKWGPSQVMRTSRTRYRSEACQPPPFELWSKTHRWDTSIADNGGDDQSGAYRRVASSQPIHLPAVRGTTRLNVEPKAGLAVGPRLDQRPDLGNLQFIGPRAVVTASPSRVISDL